MSNLKDFYGRRRNATRYTSPTTWTNPGSVNAIYVSGVGGGGGGSNPSPTPYGTSPGSQSAAGGFVDKRVYWVGGSPAPVTVGAGGAAAANGNDSRVGPTTTGVICQKGLSAATQTGQVHGGFVSVGGSSVEPDNSGYVRHGAGYTMGAPSTANLWGAGRGKGKYTGPTSGSGGGSATAGDSGHIIIEWFE